uniref:Uncharacterized protein n=1 Tax=viral metagenome TaxID=1070528 RepID=A0A6C0BNT0_9ZZZZ
MRSLTDYDIISLRGIRYDRFIKLRDSLYSSNISQALILGDRYDCDDLFQLGVTPMEDMLMKAIQFNLRRLVLWIARTCRRIMGIDYMFKTFTACMNRRELINEYIAYDPELLVEFKEIIMMSDLANIMNSKYVRTNPFKFMEVVSFCDSRGYEIGDITSTALSMRKKGKKCIIQ